MDYLSYSLLSNYVTVDNPANKIKKGIRFLKVSRFQNIEHALACFYALDFRQSEATAAILKQDVDVVKNARLFQVNGSHYDPLPLLELYKVQWKQQVEELPSGIYYLSGRNLGILKKNSEFPLEGCHSYDPNNIIMQVGKYDEQETLQADKGWLRLHNQSTAYLSGLAEQQALFSVVKHSMAFGVKIAPDFNYGGRLIEEYFHYDWKSALRHLSAIELAAEGNALLHNKSALDYISKITVNDHKGTELLRIEVNRYNAGICNNPDQPGVYMYCNSQEALSVDLARHLTATTSPYAYIIANYTPNFDAIVPDANWEEIKKYAFNVNDSLLTQQKKTIHHRHVMAALEKGRQHRRRY